MPHGTPSLDTERSTLLGERVEWAGYRCFWTTVINRHPFCYCRLRYVGRSLLVINPTAFQPSCRAQLVRHCWRIWPGSIRVDDPNFSTVPGRCPVTPIATRGILPLHGRGFCLTYSPALWGSMDLEVGRNIGACVSPLLIVGTRS